MLDPFRTTVSEPVQTFLVRISNTFGLSTLPLHAHEVLLALALNALIAQAISPAISARLFPDAYSRFSPRMRINWHVHVVSLVQSCLINALSLYVILVDGERRSWAQDDADWHLRIWGYTGLTGFLQSFALGYFLWDLYVCVRYVGMFGWGMVVHAVASSAMFTFGYRPFIHFYCPVFLLHELSTPFLNIHWFCDKLDLTGSVYQAVNGVLLTTVFFCCRLVWGTRGSIGVFRDVYRATFTGIPPSQHLQDKVAQFPNYSNLEDPLGQTTSFMEARQLPLWLGASYLMANVALALLNVFWFFKMVQAIRKRFDPPFGTRRVGNDKGNHSKEE
ncbi:DUF887-domain-containing protein [Polychaeton citri CBS 116435]|uniref:DUF887-domain-containing protein n=1 Tax=Polychaeton citri CBS 116435 TaxID=1314669 RepID=A0A9P4UPA4_9PEZI|nr:DUF887-domain-containing protein [Polychaeton citri CBS 116435]